MQAESSLLSFADMASNSDSGYWTDSDFTGPIPSSSCSNFPSFPEPSLEGNCFSPDVGSRETSGIPARQETHFDVFNATDLNPSNEGREDLVLLPQDSPTLSDETLHQTHTTQLTKSHDEIMLEPSSRLSEKALMRSDDPFMGSWASEKAHLFHDYDWVLSHVENLCSSL